MLVPLSWLKEYIELDLPSKKIASELQASGTIVNQILKDGDDEILECEITPNRPDTLSIIGIAREIAAIYSKNIKFPHLIQTVENQEKKISINVSDNKICPYYSIGILENIKVEKSPDWLKNRLRKVGIRSVNNVVDATNYVMHEVGIPMHAFDLDKIEGKINIRLSKVGEEIITLDGVKREIPEKSIIIEDENKIIDLAGIMGGKNSEVDPNTTNILLHVPIYNSYMIRLTSQKLALRSEASNRFEKKLDPNGHRLAFERAALLLGEIAQGKLASKIISKSYPIEQTKIKTNISKINNFLGLDISQLDMLQIFKRLGFSYQSDKNQLFVEIPSYRTDIKEDVDLVEEVARIYGYNNFPRTLPSGEVELNEEEWRIEGEIKNRLAILGLNEIYSSAMLSLSELAILGIQKESCLKVKNRLVIDYEYLRPNLNSGLFKSARENKMRYEKIALFEIGNVYLATKDQNLKFAHQEKKIGLLFTGYDYLEAKSHIDTFFNKFNINLSTIVVSESSQENSAKFMVGDKPLGEVKQVRKEILAKYELPENTFVCEISYRNFVENSKPPVYKSSPKYPVVVEDISIFVLRNTKYGDIETEIKKSLGSNLYSIEIIEDTIFQNKRSLLLRLNYFDQEKTLDKKKIEGLRIKTIKSLSGLGAEIRKNKETKVGN